MPPDPAYNRPFPGRLRVRRLLKASAVTVCVRSLRVQPVFGKVVRQRALADAHQLRGIFLHAARAISVIGAITTQTSSLPSLKLRQNIEWVERETIRRALESAAGIKKDAAELMGISQRALSYYLAKYRLDS